MLEPLTHGRAALRARCSSASADLGAGGSLVFTGTERRPRHARHPGARWASRTRPRSRRRIRGWHHGHIRATRSARARELLTELMPRLLQALAQPARPRRRVQAASTSSSPACRPACSSSRCSAPTRGCSTLLADLMGVAPRLAATSARQVDLLDAMLTPDFFERLPERDALEAELALAAGRRARPPGHARHLPALGARAAVPGRPAACCWASARRPRRRRGADRHRRDRARRPAADGRALARRAARSASRAAASSCWASASSAPRADGRLRPRPRLRLRRAGGRGLRRRRARCRPPTYYARLGQRLVTAITAPRPPRAALRDRHAAAPLGQHRPGRRPRSPPSPATSSRPRRPGSSRR